MPDQNTIGTEKCVWCNGSGVLKQVTIVDTGRLGLERVERTVPVHPEHEDALREFNQFAVRNVKRFLLLLASLWLAIIPLEVVLLRVNVRWGTIGLALVVCASGAVVTLYPFATPETVKVFGVRAAVRLARVLGLLVLLMGLVLLAVLPRSFG